jgi:hypothetical protein
MTKIPLQIERDKPASQGLRILARMIARAYLARQTSNDAAGRGSNGTKSDEEVCDGTGRAKPV